MFIPFIQIRIVEKFRFEIFSNQAFKNSTLISLESNFIYNCLKMEVQVLHYPIPPSHVECCKSVNSFWNQRSNLGSQPHNIKPLNYWITLHIHHSLQTMWCFGLTPWLVNQFQCKVRHYCIKKISCSLSLVMQKWFFFYEGLLFWSNYRVCMKCDVNNNCHLKGMLVHTLDLILDLKGINFHKINMWEDGVSREVGHGQQHLGVLASSNKVVFNKCF